MVVGCQVFVKQLNTIINKWMMKRLENIKKTPQADFFLQCFYTMVLSSIDCTFDASTLVQHTQDEWCNHKID